MPKKNTLNDRAKKLSKSIESKNTKNSEELNSSINKISKELEKTNSKTKWGGVSLIPIFTLLSTITIAFFTIQISNGNLEIVKGNQKLTYDTNITYAKGKKNEQIEDTDGIQEMKIENTIESGKIKVIYVVTQDANEDTGYRFTKLNANAENGFDYTMTGTVDQLKRLSINFFVYYVDMSDNIYYDYVVIFAEYIDVVNNISIWDEDGKSIHEENRKKIIPKNSKMEILNQYDFVTSTIYDEKVKDRNKDLNLKVQSYDEVKNMSHEINEILNSNL